MLWLLNLLGRLLYHTKLHFVHGYKYGTRVPKVERRDPHGQKV